MTAATSTLSSSARRALRAAAHHLDPVVMVGQHGLTPAVLHEIDLALTAHALIKVRVMSDEREIRVGFLNEICEKMGCESVQHLGKLLVLWRNAAGEAGADDDAEQDAASVKASKSGRGPRTKLPAEWANAEAPTGTRSGSVLPPGERRRYGEIPPAPRREGWAPKDRRGAARAGGEEALGTRRREEKGVRAEPLPRSHLFLHDAACPALLHHRRAQHLDDLSVPSLRAVARAGFHRNGDARREAMQSPSVRPLELRHSPIQPGVWYAARDLTCWP